MTCLSIPFSMLRAETWYANLIWVQFLIVEAGDLPNPEPFLKPFILKVWQTPGGGDGGVVCPPLPTISYLIQDLK